MARLAGGGRPGEPQYPRKGGGMFPPVMHGTIGRRAKRRSVPLDTAIDQARAGEDTQLLNIRPMKTINPDRPRTLSAGYDSITETIFVRFREGTRNHPTAGWEYHNVPPNVWRNFIRVNSPGRYINAVLNGYPHGPSHGW